MQGNQNSRGDMPNQSRAAPGSKLKPTILATSVVLAAIAAARPLAAQQAPQGLPAGRYALLMRDSTARNPFGESYLTISAGGEILWERDGQPFAMMRYVQQGEILTVEDADLCPLNPVGDYMVRLRGTTGYQLDLINDGCGDRSTSVALTWLKPENSP